MLLMLRIPKLDAALQVGSHEIGVGVGNGPQKHLLAPFYAVQDTIAFLGCKSTWPCHIELLVSQHHQVILGRAVLNPLFAQLVFVLQASPNRLLDLALGHVETPGVHTGPDPQAVEVALDLPCLQGDCTTQLGAISSLLKVHPITLSMLPAEKSNSVGPNLDL
ncbi:hypothetical protein TURU_122279 [Turdus rufiventris]|nr:hypothetical protein TURU_122279 [Turdus rufiventris]